MNDEFTRQSVALSLKKMFESSHFSICTVDAGLEALKITPIKGQYESLRPLHCVHWSSMDSDFRQEVFQRVLALFQDATSFDLVAIDRQFGVPIMQAIQGAVDGPSKRKMAGLLPFQRRA